MAAQPRNNVGVRVLDEFVCEAKLGPQVPETTSGGRGANVGVHLITELVVCASHAPVAEERKADLHECSSSELLAPVQADRRAARLAELSRKARHQQASAEELAELERLENQASPPAP